MRVLYVCRRVRPPLNKLENVLLLVPFASARVVQLWNDIQCHLEQLGLVQEEKVVVSVEPENTKKKMDGWIEKRSDGSS